MKSNRPELKNRRKKLRNNSTPAECELWKYLKARKVCGLKFRRQHSIDNYILDFYCPKLKLGIELDGEYHAYNEEYDRQRDSNLERQGIRVIRYENIMVFEHIETIIGDIEDFYNNCDNKI
jgi:very-short-patch-repair endonuclease